MESYKREKGKFSEKEKNGIGSRGLGGGGRQALAKFEDEEELPQSIAQRADRVLEITCSPRSAPAEPG